MDYSNNKSLYKYFDEYVKKESSTIIQKLEKELDEMHSSALVYVKKELEDEKNAILDAKKKNIYLKHQKKLNELKRKYNLELVNERQELLKKLIEEVENKLQKYLGTQKYEEGMLALISQHENEIEYVEINSNDVVVSKISKKLIKTNDQILGGINIALKNKNYIIDATFNTKLEEAKRWFYENARLFVEEE